MNIEKGGLWEVRLKEGIRSAAVLAAVITPYVLREESVCRDEVVFALDEGKSIIPLRLDSSPNLKSAALLCQPLSLSVKIKLNSPSIKSCEFCPLRRSIQSCRLCDGLAEIGRRSLGR
jgi:hypothetical protein